MTIEPTLIPADTVATDTDPTADALRTVIFGTDAHLHAQVRAAVTALGDTPRSSLTYSQQAALSPGLLRPVIEALGGSAVAIARDTRLRGVLCEWAAVAAPALFPVLTGHFDLAIGAILTLGTGADYQQQRLAALDTGDALGVLALTELGGTNGADQQTTAIWDRASGEFRLTTPSQAAVKFMPNVAAVVDDDRARRIVVVTARLVVDGRGEGVLPFLLELRTSAGLAPGLDIVRLPDKTATAMDHALIRFRDVRLPREALLGGDWARLNADGRFECALPVRARWHRAISVLDAGRLDLANGAVASARAALAGLVNYSRQRRPGEGTVMADRDAVQLDLVTGVAAVYAITALGRCLHELRAGAAPGDPEQALWSMLAKPLLSDTAYRVLLMCRRRAGAHGTLRINYLPDWISNADGVVTAEGENQILAKTAGQPTINHPMLRLPGTPEKLPHFVEMLAERERIISSDGLRRCNYHEAGPVLGPDSAAIKLATATAERLAATALVIAASTTTDPAAARLLESMAAAYGLGRIYADAGWYLAHDRMNSAEAAAVVSELRAHYTVVAQALPLLVRAFDIPELPAPLFAKKYLEAWADYAGWSTPADTNDSKEQD